MEAATRALREISHIHDGVTVKALKGVIERQVRMLNRMEAIEDELGALQKLLKSAGFA
jgi:hypothetical protein